MSSANPITERASTALTSGRTLATNAVLNLVGTCLPALFAVICLPVLKHRLGTDRLGIISLAWVIIGYFGLFDLGLSRALTKLVAQHLGEDRCSDIPVLVWTSLAALFCLGVVAGLATFFVSPWLVGGPLKIPSPLYRETLTSFYWLSCSIPVVMTTAGLRG